MTAIAEAGGETNQDEESEKYWDDHSKHFRWGVDYLDGDHGDLGGDLDDDQDNDILDDDRNYEYCDFYLWSGLLKWQASVKR